MAWFLPSVPGQRVHLMSLPAEIRLQVYSDVFRSAVLIPGDRATQTGFVLTRPFIPRSSHEHANVSDFYGSGFMPGLLTVSKAIREETPPVFIANVVPCFMDATMLNVIRIPGMYLSSAPMAVVQSDSNGQVSEVVLPSMRQLGIRDRGIIMGADRQLELLEDRAVIGNAMLVARYKPAFVGVDLRVSQGYMPFTVTMASTMSTMGGKLNYLVVYDYNFQTAHLRGYV